MNEPRDYSAIILEMQGILKLMYQYLSLGRKKEAEGLARRLKTSMKEIESYLNMEKL